MSYGRAPTYRRQDKGVACVCRDENYRHRIIGISAEDAGVIAVWISDVHAG